MNEFELFQKYDVASWQASGVITPIAMPAAAPRRRRRAKDYLVSVVASTVLCLSIVGYNLPVDTPAIATLDWPATPTAALTKQLLADALKALKRFGPDWNGYSAPAPAQSSLTAAERLIPELPDVAAEVRAGVDDDGNVYFRLAKGDKIAYLTIEPELLHLVCMTPDKGNYYVDDEPFRKKLPATIRKALTTTLT